MTFTVEVLLRGQPDVVAAVVQHEVVDPTNLTDNDVRDVLRLTLVEFDRVQNPDAVQHQVSLLGLSWIVTPLDQGVAIAIEIPSGAVVAGPFDVDAGYLSQAITRVLALCQGRSKIRLPWRRKTRPSGS